MLDLEGNPIYVRNTALHVAFGSEDEEAISILYANSNIKDDIRNHEGETPEGIIQNKIDKLLDETLKDSNLDAKRSLKKTMNAHEQKKLLIESQIEEAIQNRGNSATVQNQEDKFMAEDISNDPNCGLESSEKAKKRG